MQLRRFGTAALALSGLALLSAHPAQAQTVTISYTVGSFSFSQTDASFTLNPRTQSVILTPNVAKNDVNLQAVKFVITSTTTPEDNTGTASRSLTINGVTNTVSQPFELISDFGNTNGSSMDSLFLSPGTTTTYDLGAQGILSITPRSYSDVNEDNGTLLNNVQATFLLRQAAPEPSQFAALGLGVLGLGALCLRARRRASSAA